MKKKNKHKKIWGALALGVLVLSGGALAVPLTPDGSLSDSSSCGNLKAMQNNMGEIVKINDWAVPDDFDYLKELNNVFVKDHTDEVGALDEDTLKEAVKSGDYQTWKETLSNFGEFQNEAGIISKEEFSILTQLRNMEDSNKSAK